MSPKIIIVIIIHDYFLLIILKNISRTIGQFTTMQEAARFNTCSTTHGFWASVTFTFPRDVGSTFVPWSSTANELASILRRVDESGRSRTHSWRTDARQARTLHTERPRVWYSPNCE